MLLVIVVTERKKLPNLGFITRGLPFQAHTLYPLGYLMGILVLNSLMPKWLEGMSLKGKTMSSIPD